MKNLKLDFYHVDAFTDKAFKGNPAGVCPLEEWLKDDVLQWIAFENNLPITVFFKKEDNFYKIRWFTPTSEVDLCGHGSLAAAYVIFNFFNSSESVLNFKGMLGDFEITLNEDRFCIDFPLYLLAPYSSFGALEEILGEKPKEVWVFEKDVVLAVFETEEKVRAFTPDFSLIERLKFSCLGITALGRKVDFVSRWFAPKMGLPEDSVTGSAHCLLAPFWGERLKKNKMIAHQVSSREGVLALELKKNRVEISGQACLYLKGEIFLKVEE